MDRNCFRAMQGLVECPAGDNGTIASTREYSSDLFAAARYRQLPPMAS